MSVMPLAVTICGASGRMGKELISLCLTTPETKLAAACTRAASPLFGKDVSHLIGGNEVGLRFINSIPARDENRDGKFQSVIIDFSSPDALFEHSTMAAKLKIPLLVCMSGVHEAHQAHLQEIAKKIPVLVAPNTSMGANLLALLSGLAAKSLADADVEICETHHRYKKDSPSGAAYFIADHMAKARGAELEAVACFDRKDHGQRKKGEIGVFGLRGGNEVGTHTVHLFEDDEAFELTHRVTNRRVFAVGALKAARFLVEQPSGLYNMFDVFRMGGLLGEKA